jgi:hypothetical protein
VIVRASPRRQGRHTRALTYRERWYCIEAWRSGYTSRHMKRHLRGDSERFWKIVKFLGLPRRPHGVAAAPKEWPEEPKRPQIRRCSECYQLYGREECPCLKGVK